MRKNNDEYIFPYYETSLILILILIRITELQFMILEHTDTVLGYWDSMIKISTVVIKNCKKSKFKFKIKINLKMIMTVFVFVFSDKI